MRKRKAPIVAIFILALCLAIAGFWNAKNTSPLGVFDPEAEQHRAEQAAASAPPPAAQSDAARRGDMANQLGPVAPTAPGSQGGPGPVPASR